MTADLAQALAGGGLIDIGFLAWPVTVIWIVGFTNVINLADGLDGLLAAADDEALGHVLHQESGHARLFPYRRPASAVAGRGRRRRDLELLQFGIEQASHLMLLAWGPACEARRGPGTMSSGGPRLRRPPGRRR